MHRYLYVEGFRPRGWQDGITSTILSNLNNNGKIALEAPTGSGKTSFILYLAFLSGKKFIYSVRTHNEFTRIYEDNKRFFNLDIAYMFGKKSLCPLPDRWLENDDSDRDICTGCFLKDKTIDVKFDMEPEELCNFLLRESMENINIDIKNRSLVKNEKGDYYYKREKNSLGFCPYYSVRLSALSHNIIVMTYNYLLNPGIRYRTFGIENFNDYCIVFDEAHNIDDFVENFGRSLRPKTVERAIEQSMNYFPVKEYKCNDRTRLGIMLERLLLELDLKESGTLKRFSFSKDFIDNLDIDIIKRFSDMFNDINEKNPAGQRHRNYLESLYNFLYDVFNSENSGLYYYSDKNGILLKIMYYDVSSFLRFLNSSPVIFMSGTMPSPEHISLVWGFENIIYISVEKIFKNAGGEKKYHIVTGFTTLNKYRLKSDTWEPMLKKYMDFIKERYNSASGSVLVAVPAYSILSGDKSISSFIDDDIKPHVIIETRKLSFSYIKGRALREKLLIFSVHGGKLLEGVQLVNKNRSLISDVIIMGLPLIPMDDYRTDKIKFIERQSKRNMQDNLYYENAMIKVKQAAGRSTRSENDVADIWLCDDRFSLAYWRDIFQN